MNKFFNNIRDNVEYLIWGILVLAVLCTILFTQFSSCISFHDTGQVGDTIGGINWLIHKND